MTAILRRLPFLEAADEVSCGRQRIPIKAYQIILWVSVVARSVLDLPPQAMRIPAILDTGHNHLFSMNERHLTDWAEVVPALLPRRRTIRAKGVEVPLHAGAVWVHPNEPGFRDRFMDQSPYRLELRDGIAVYPREHDFPRLPLLGLRTLVHNQLHFSMDPQRCLINLRTRDWRTKILQWLSKSRRRRRPCRTRHFE